MAGKLQIDTDGFRKRVAWRGIVGVLTELVSNAFDESITRCDVRITQTAFNKYALSVEDDAPDGFKNLDDSYTLYADSYKAALADKRGRFNVGEKIAIVLCETASITSTTGTRVFTRNDVSRSKIRRAKGTLFEGVIRSTKGDVARALDVLGSLIVPEGVDFTVNGERIERPARIAQVEASLPTVAANADGELVKTARITTVDVYRRRGERGAIYELGVPVLGVEHPYIMDVRQKVPLSTDRNNVTPGFYRKLCGAVLDGTADLLTEDEARSKGVVEGIAQAKSDSAVIAVAEKRHGRERYVPDPKNAEGNGTLFARGYQPVYGGSYDRETWARLNAAQAIPSVNVLMPKTTVPPERYDGEITTAMRITADFAKALCRELLGKSLTVEFSGNRNVDCVAQCGPSGEGAASLTFHVHKLGGPGWFSTVPLVEPRVLDLILHELGHHNAAQDCTRAHTAEVTKLAAELVKRVLVAPLGFRDYR